ncbi:MAG: hypothetical protein NC432_05315 [Roseburia sp.]|nr:hypothetical protein [Roseburia sp.]MCM1097927.1 hypothetical protein [Ruminococcus flavefaciens]
MDKAELYIGKPNGVVLCVDRRESCGIAGRIYHSYSREAIPFSGMEDVIFQLERFFDYLNFPHPTTSNRLFCEGTKQEITRQERIAIMKDEELLNQHGDLGTFLVHVQHRQNSSWQGRITWVDQKKTVYFRSALEMLKLVSDALESVSDDDTTDPSWQDAPEA